MYSLTVTYTERDVLADCTEDFQDEEKAKSRAYEVRKHGLWHEMEGKKEVLIPPEHIHRIVLDF